MELLLREKRSTLGREEYQDQELSVPTLVIGSGAEATIRLLGEGVVARHAEITVARGAAELRCRGRQTVTVDSRAERRVRLAPGTTVAIGPHRLSVFEAPPGFDLALALERDPNVGADHFEAAFVTELGDTWLEKRRVSWVLAGAVLLVALAVPWLASTALAPTPPGVVPTDRLWSSGPLLPAHQLALGDDCRACHQTPFVHVRDSACTECHAGINGHLDGPATLAVAGHPALEESRCAVCHREHNEPESLVVTASALCVTCHATVEPGIDAFAAGAHPPFGVTLTVPVVTEIAGGRRIDWHAEHFDLAGAEDPSGLKFPHDVHLDPGRVISPADGSALGCGDCHALRADEEHFVPVTMERSCRQCHDLSFDPQDPTRQLPHGAPREAVLAMEGHFLRVFGLGDPADRVDRRRLPNRPAPPARCTGDPFACAREATRREVEAQFNVRGCVTCHTVSSNRGNDVYTRFQIHPVRLTTDFMPSMRFDHAAHLTQADASGDAACLTCHAAGDSGTSTDVLMPEMDRCLTCHADARTDERVPITCAGCHVYHPLMRETSS